MNFAGVAEWYFCTGDATSAFQWDFFCSRSYTSSLSNIWSPHCIKQHIVWQLVLFMTLGSHSDSPNCVRMKVIWQIMDISTTHIFLYKSQPFTLSVGNNLLSSLFTKVSTINQVYHLLVKFFMLLNEVQFFTRWCLIIYYIYTSLNPCCARTLSKYIYSGSKYRLIFEFFGFF